ncbi:MAG: tetratricopeptide repeat protein [Planctomycetes bacterium]|nr:tetratricopeptide repeat protein [Planctomycetota bacterium]
MSSENSDVDGLLSELCGLPAEQRVGRLRAAGDVDQLLYLLAEQAEELAVSEVGRALEATQVVMALADSLGRSRERGRARRARAQTLSYAGKFSEALPLFREAGELARQAGDAVEAARADMSSIHPLAGMGRYDEAISCGEAARGALIAAGERVLAARCDMNLGATYQRRGDAAAAVRVFDRARPLVDDDPITLAKLYSNRGHALIDLDEFDAAEESYGRALAIFEDNAVDWAVAIVEGNLAELATRQGRLQRAFSHFERARGKLELDESAGEVARLLAEQADAQEQGKRHDGDDHRTRAKPHGCRADDRQGKEERICALCASSEMDERRRDEQVEGHLIVREANRIRASLQGDCINDG